MVNHKFFDDPALFAAVAEWLSDVQEPAVQIYYRGALIGNSNHHTVHLFDRTPDGSGHPGTFVDLVANTYVRDTYQKPGGTTGHYGTSFAGTFSYRAAGTPEQFFYVPTVDRANVSIGDSARYTSVVSGHFGSLAQVTSTRTFPDPTLAMTTVGVSNTLAAQQSMSLATGPVRSTGDVLRAGTLVSMFSSEEQFDASLILWEDRAGNVHSLQLTDATPRDHHLFTQPQELGSWIELVKGAGSDWYPDSPTVRLVIKNPHGLKLGLQGWLAATTNPNHDSLNLWPEVLNPPTTLVKGRTLKADFDVIAVAPLTDNTTYVTPFSAKLTGTPFDNVILSGSADINALGTTRSNMLKGNSGANRLEAGAGNDKIEGGSGNDILDGGTGADTMTGSNGSDRYYVDHTGDRVSESSASVTTGGKDTVYSYLAAYTLPSNVENLRLLSSETAKGTGNRLDNTLYAGAGNNVLDGSSGTNTVSYAYATGGVTVSLARDSAQATGGSRSDTLLRIENLSGSPYNDNLSGNSAANRIEGGAGNDTLSGSSGNDLLLGGLGNDSLGGGTGRDVFHFDTRPNASSNRDRISDFNVRDDTLQLENAAFTSLTRIGTLSQGSLRAGNGFSSARDANDYLIYNQTTGALYYDADGNGTDAAAVQFAILPSGLALNNLDFLVT
jgi:hypothetical protein